MTEIDWSKITRVGVVPPMNTGIEFQDAYREHWNVTVTPVLQDEGQTLKLILLADPAGVAPEPKHFPPQRRPNAVMWVKTPHRVLGMHHLVDAVQAMYGGGARLQHGPGGYWIVMPEEEPVDGGPVGDKADLSVRTLRDDDPVHPGGEQ